MNKIGRLHASLLMAAAPATVLVTLAVPAAAAEQAYRFSFERAAAIPDKSAPTRRVSTARLSHAELNTTLFTDFRKELGAP